jgi:AcrR family transcriptional regulator
MATRRPLRPRKQPQQQRSKAVVDTLLEATARILERSGLEETSTNEIARVAGVSVGSLYQYFPSKEALVAALIERKVELDLREIGGVVEKLQGGPLDSIIAGVVRASLEMHRRDRGLLRALLELVPRVGRHAQVRQLAAQGRVGLRQLLEAHQAELRRVDLDIPTFIVGRLLEELAHAALFERPELLEDPRFADEVTYLVMAYLRA